MTDATCRNRARPLLAVFAAVACTCGAATAGTGDCPGDTDASGAVDIVDFLAVLADWGCTNPPGPCAGDVSGDGLVSIEDLLGVLLNWGPCPGAAASAADAGLMFAAQTLAQEASRFVITRGQVDAAYAHDLWLGTYDPADGAVTILPAEGYEGDPAVSSLVGAVLDAHNQTWAPLPLPSPADEGLPEIDEFGTLRVLPVPLTLTGWDGPYFRLTYELLEGLPQVRVTSEGVVGAISHTLSMDFRIDKRIDYAVISPGRVMIGKNVSVTGALGTRYGIVPGELDDAAADPLVMLGDFEGLDDSLDATLETLYQQIVAYDADGDNRLRTSDPVESQGLIGQPDLVDYDGNGYVEDLDLFMAQYDANGDGWVVYDQLLANEAGLGVPAEEFSGVDDQLARLIDVAFPDRNGDGESTMDDRLLGYRDGVIDVKDHYAKLHGRLAFAVGRAEWELAHGESYQTVVQGPIRPGADEPAVSFEVGERELPEISADMFQTAVAWFEAQVPADPPTDPADFNAQVAAGVGAGGTFLPGGAGNNWEPIPFASQGAYDYYDRPIYSDMTFADVRIPMGNNGLYENCEFRGVTFIETEINCVHENWNYAGALEKVESPPGSGIFIYEPKYPGVEAQLDGIPIPDTKPYSNNIRFHDCTFIGSVAGDTPGEFTHWRNHVQFSGETRFYIDPDDPDLDGQADAADIRAVINAMDAADLAELRKSSFLLPGWPVNIRSAGEAENRPKVKLTGTIVAGTFEAHGTLDFRGTLMVTFRAAEGEGPLFYGGHPSAFKNAIGWFGPDDGDYGEITVRDDPDVTLLDGLPWHMSVVPLP